MPKPGQKDEVRLVLNLLLVGLMAIPRGGKVSAALKQTPFTARIEVNGQGANLNEEICRALEGQSDLGTIDARMIQPYFAGVIARRLGASIELSGSGDDLTIEARAVA